MRLDSGSGSWYLGLGIIFRYTNSLGGFCGETAPKSPSMGRGTLEVLEDVGNHPEFISYLGCISSVFMQR
jgi:hypothetical protein